ncbi:hypothetical protein HHX47_DHR9000236 [Lentinula edodes]|nr:hypothetical protein HHX47_DHR9000236 [Lentinula edodes]
MDSINKWAAGSACQTGGFNPDARDRDLAFTAKDEPATLPRVSQLIIITEISPWCTIVKNERGVNLGDVCSQIWKDYSDHHVTDAEFASLPPRLQDQVKRTATMRGTGGNWSAYYTPAAPPARFKRFGKAFNGSNELLIDEKLCAKTGFASGLSLIGCNGKTRMQLKDSVSRLQIFL